MSEVKNFPKQELYKDGNFSVSSYSFEIPNGARAGKVLDLVELKTKTKKWSDDIGSYYTQKRYITVSQEQLIGLLKTAKI